MDANSKNFEVELMADKQTEEQFTMPKSPETVKII